MEGGRVNITGYFQPDGGGANYGLERHERDFLTPGGRGVVIDVVSDDERVIPGQTLRMTATVWNGSYRTYRVSGGFRIFQVVDGFTTPEYHWDTVDSDSLRPSRPGEVDTFSLSFQVPEDTPFS